MEEEFMAFSEWENGQSQDNSPSEQEEETSFQSFDEYEVQKEDKDAADRLKAEQEALEQEARKNALDSIANITRTGWFGKQAMNVLGGAASIYKGLKYDLMDTIVKTFDDYTGNKLDREGEKAVTDNLSILMPMVGMPSVPSIVDRESLEEVEKFGQAARTDFGTVVDEETGETVAKDYTYLAQEGDYTNAAKAFAEDLFGALPSIGLAFVPGGALAIGASTVGSKSAEIIEENEGDSMGSIWSAATVTGAGEFATEMVTRMIGKGMFKVFGKAGTKGVKSVFNKIANTTLAATGEGLSEGFADTIERAADDYILGREDAWDGAGRSFVRNSLVGAVMGGGINMLTPSPQRTMVIKQTQPSQITNAQKQAAVEIMDLEKSADDATSDEAREIINKQIKEKKQSLDTSNRVVENQFASMSDEQLKELTQTSGDIAMYEDMINDPNYDNSSKSIFQQEIVKLKQKQEELFVNPEYIDIKRKEPVAARSIKLSKEAQKLYETEANPTVIADKLGGVAGTVANRKWSMVAPDLQVGTYQDFLSALKFGKGGIVDMVRTYKPEKNDSIAAYVASLMDKRADRIIGKFTKRKAETSVDTARGIMAEESGPTAAELADRLTIPQKTLEKAATNAELFNLKLDKISNIKDYVKQQKDFFKTYLTPEIKSFLKPKGSQLEKQKALKNYVYKNVDTLKDLYMAAPGLNKVRSGPIAAWSITPPTNKEFADYVMGEDLDLSTPKGRNALNSRKDKITERIADSIGQKAWQEFVDSDQEARDNINKLSKQLIEDAALDFPLAKEWFGKAPFEMSTSDFSNQVKSASELLLKQEKENSNVFDESDLHFTVKDFAKSLYNQGALKGNYGGVIFEDATISFLKSLGIPVLEAGGAGYDSTLPDIQIKYTGGILSVEVKLSSAVRYGQVTANIDSNGKITYKVNGKDTPSGKIPSAGIFDAVLNDSINKGYISQILDKINELEGLTGDNKITGFPMGGAINTSTVNALKQLPAYKNLTAKQLISPKAIVSHYNSKGVYYIEIGSSTDSKGGLYHLGTDPLNLGTTAFDFETVARFRFKQSGKSTEEGLGRYSLSAENVLKNLKIPASNFSLQNVEDVATLKAKLENISPDDKLSFQLKRQEVIEAGRDPKEKQINEALAKQFKDISNTPASEDASRTLTAMLDNAWDGVIESTTNKSTAIEYLKTNEGLSQAQAESVVSKVNGFQQGNFVFVNRDSTNMDTMFHEFQHVWNKVVYNKSPRVFNSIYEKIKNEAPELYAQQAKRIKESGYKFEEDSFEWKDEVIAGIGGLNIAKEFTTPEQQKSFKDLMLEYWNIVKKFLGITKMAKDKSLQDMTVGEVLDAIAAEVLSGKPGSVLSKMKPESWLKNRLIKKDPSFSISQDLQFKGLQKLKEVYRETKDLSKAIEAGYNVVKGSYSLETWTEFVNQAAKETQVNNSKTLAVAKATWLASNDISLDNIKELEKLKFNEELNRKARNLIYTAKDKGKPSKWFIPPNAEDFRGLLYTLFPKGKAGKEAKEFYTKYILDPYHQGVQNANAEVVNKLKSIKEVVTGVNINEDIEGTPYNIGTAVKAYNWVRNGQDPLPNSKSSQKQAIIDRMIATVDGNPKLVELADFLNDNINIPYSDANLTTSLGQSILSEVEKGVRSKNLETFANNVDAIFDQTNLDQLESQFGKSYVQSLKATIKRMKTGRNRSGLDAQANVFAKWLGRAVGSTMFINRRSALLQTISFINFVGKENNNIFQATKAYANPEANEVLKKLWTSDYLVNRREGAKFDVLADEIANEKNLIDKVLNFGFWPTKMADSFAIAFGGVPYYINTKNALIKEGMEPKEAEAVAMQKWVEAAEETQQSSDPSKISEIQASTVGKIIYAFANTPFQYARYAKRKLQDIANGTSKNPKKDMGSILYYTIGQAAMFSALQSGLLALAMFGDEEDEDLIDEKTIQAIERSITSFLKSLGNPGAITAATYSVLKEATQDRTSGEKIALAATEISPPLNSKLRDLNSAYWAKKYDDIPGMIGKIGSFVGIPLDNVLAITNSMVAFTNDQLETWQKIMLALGWSEWDVAPNIKKEKKSSESSDWEDATWNDDEWMDVDEWADEDWEDSPVKKLENGVAGRANNDGTIEIDPNLSPVEREKTVAHEEQHMKDMKSGKLNYDDDYVYWNDAKYKRENGKIKYKGKSYIEGHKNLPWEKKAYAAEPSTSAVRRRLY